MITISFYSYKGGVGRSLTLANLGVYLAQFGARVTMIDFDLEAPGLHYKLSNREAIKSHGRGVAGMLADVSRGKPLDRIDWDLGVDVSDFAVPKESPNEGLDQPRGELFLIPAGDPLSPSYWKDLANIDWNQLFATDMRPGVAALERLKSKIKDNHNPDVLLVDSRTGITPGGGVATTLLPNVVVMMMLNSPEHLDGSKVVASTVASTQRTSGESPEVVPVLSRYISPKESDDKSVAQVAKGRDEFGPSLADEAPLADLYGALTRGLSRETLARVQKPLVIHSDRALQHRERLSFGPNADASGAGGPTLLEDYLRLFAALVPRETFLRYLKGVREQARSILLDQPEDAVRTLESLATLVGDEDAFIDLVKVYVLRRDSRNLLLAAGRLFRVHNRIVPQEPLSEEIRNLLVGRMRHRTDGLSLLSEDFVEKYWRKVAPEDLQWGAAVARLLADREQPVRAVELAKELIDRDSDPENAGVVIRSISLGGRDAEAVAGELARDYFSFGRDSLPFLEAAAGSATYLGSKDLSDLLLTSNVTASLPSEVYIRLLLLSGDVDRAESVFTQDVFSREVFSRQFGEIWQELDKRIPRLREELVASDPALVEQLDSIETSPF